MPTVAQAIAKIEVSGDSEAKSKLSGMKQAVEETSGGFKGMLSNALNFAAGLGIYNIGAQAVGFLKNQVSDMFKVTMEHQDVLSQTATVIKSTGDASGMSAKALNDLAESLSHTTTFSEDATQSGENLLLTFTGIGKDVFPQATKTMLDMSKAMGQDIKSSAIQLGKALNDPAQGLTALTRVGVTFTDKQKEMIQHMVAVGDTAGAQKIMLAELQREFGGSAEAAGKTFGGQLEILKNRLDETKEKIGTALMPMLNQLLGFVTGTILPGMEHFGALMGQVWSILDDEGLGILIASFQNLANTIGGALSPVLTPLANTFKSIFSDSSIISDAHNLEGSFYNIANVIDTVSDGIKKLTGFFQGNSIQAQIVKDLMVGIGVAIATIQIGAFLATVPALIAGFIGWATAAGAAAIATIAATWPILAIGAAIALVVAGIILAVQHWGQIVDWLKGAWGGISSWFSGILNSVKVWFTWLWATIQADTLKAWLAIQNFLKGALQVVLDIVLGPIYAIVDGFIWLYNHNYYFKALVDAIVNFFKGCFAWVQSAWADAINWLVGLWNGLVAFATVLWDNVSMQIKIGFQRAILFVQSVWNAISSFFSNAWSTYIAGPLHTLWTNVSNVFSSAWSTYIAGPIGGLWNMLSSTVSGWAGMAVDWGKNLIQGFVNGIVGMANSVAGAVGGIAGKVLAFLGFHSPTKEGPGREADQWAPNFINMFATGLESGLPRIRNAVSRLMTPLSVNLNPLSGGSSLASSMQFPAMQSAQPSSSQVQAVNLQIDGQTFARLVLPAFTDQVRHQVGIWDMS